MTVALTILGAIAVFAIVTVGTAFVVFVARKPPPDSQRSDRKPQLFNAHAEDLTLQSADNLRLFSDAQLKEIEDRNSE